MTTMVSLDLVSALHVLDDLATEACIPCRCVEDYPDGHPKFGHHTPDCPIESAVLQAIHLLKAYNATVLICGCHVCKAYV
jgi:hypothetical protein